jgi:hypothetical protein
MGPSAAADLGFASETVAEVPRGGRATMRQDSQEHRRVGLLPHAGKRVPHFDVVTIDGTRVPYVDAIWQRRNLLLVLLPDVTSPSARRYLASLTAVASDLATLRATLVVTSEAVGDLRPPAALVADEWGEVAHVEAPDDGRVASLSDPEELMSWVRYLSTRCPECEGEVY